MSTTCAAARTFFGTAAPTGPAGADAPREIIRCCCAGERRVRPARGTPARRPPAGAPLVSLAPAAEMDAVGAAQPGGAGESYGRALLERMGWTAGTGLGAKGDGMVNPLRAKSRVEKLGVGAERARPFADAWWDKMMDDVYGRGAVSGADDLLEACEGRRCLPHGSAKLRRVAAADRLLGERNVGATVAAPAAAATGPSAAHPAASGNEREERTGERCVEEPMQRRVMREERRSAREARRKEKEARRRRRGERRVRKARETDRRKREAELRSGEKRAKGGRIVKARRTD
jgi:hypothetical protein